MTNITDFRWTPAADATLEQMAGELKTATMIGNVLGVTRNAVLGRAKRTGVKLGPELFWTDERVEQARAMVLDGKSHAEIGRELGASTRLSVSSILKRRGIKSPPKPQRAPVMAATKPRPPRAPMPTLAPPTGPTTPRILADLGYRQCRYPITGYRQCRYPITGAAHGDCSTILFCAAVTPEKSSWCPEHRARVLVAPTQAQKKIGVWAGRVA